MFLNDPSRLAVLDRLGENSLTCFDAVQRSDIDSFTQTIAASWSLNQQLDVGTNPTEVRDLLDRIASHLSAWKLAGAGGGGFLYMVAKDAQHAGAVGPARVGKRSREPPCPFRRDVTFGHWPACDEELNVAA